ncbi:MAG: endolytic transglycosylase MltG, partial [Desulfobacula sp.]|nr:endolytic transglycosylase MltG [Desulfobacula sp.]
GLNIKGIADLMETAAFCTNTSFSDLCHDRSFANSLGIRSTTLEGYLFPDTYFFPKHTSCEDIIRTMVGHFNHTFTQKWQTRTKALGFSVHEIVTLASMIEKETGDASERPLIASVFHNRLKKNMRLESDPTVIYGITDFDGNIKRKHLKIPTPYNTYQIKGLPQGPIANPGALSIQAALYPARTQYLFFVSKKDTTHQFSKTFQEHNQAVKTYQLRKK